MIHRRRYLSCGREVIMSHLEDQQQEERASESGQDWEECVKRMYMNSRRSLSAIEDGATEIDSSLRPETNQTRYMNLS